MQLFEPVSVKGCADVSAEIKKISELYALEEKMISFDILQINTLHRGEKKKDFTSLSPEERDKILSNDAEYNKNDFEIRQVYDVTLRGLRENDLAPFVDLRLDSHCYELSLDLKAGLEVKNDESFFQALYEEITRKKIMHNVVIRLFDSGVKQEIINLKELFSQLQISGVLESAQSLVIAKASFIPEMEASFRFVLQEEWNKMHSESIEFASYAAKSGELVGISLKHQAGMSGRNLKGDFINVKKQESESDDKIQKLRFKDSEFNIEEKEDEVLYYAAQDGYVSVGEGELRILLDFNFPEVSLRKSGSLLGGDKKGFVVEVTCADPNQDAIGASIVLEAQDIKIYGSVAENAKVVAKKLEINGQTHQSAVIQADEMSIDIHKGSAMGEKIRINRLELGNVEGEEIVIEQANGGSIEARKITINSLHSHTRISVSEHLYIKAMSGGENHISINSRSSLKAKQEVQHFNAQIERNIKEMNMLLAVLNKDLARVRKTKPIVEKIKHIMEENKKNNKPNERSITESVAQYVVLLRRTKYLKERLLTLQAQSKDFSSALENLDLQTQNAKITSDAPWQNDNEIVYESFFPEVKDIMLLSHGEEVDIGIDKESLKLVREVRS